MAKRRKNMKNKSYGARSIPGAPMIFDIHNTFTKEIYDSLFDDNAMIVLEDQNTTIGIISKEDKNLITHKLSKKKNKVNLFE